MADDAAGNNVAIFLDVENLSGWLKAGGGEMLLDYANKLGSIVIRRAYGDFSLPSVSARQPELNLLGFDFVHVYHPVKGKNSTDIQIVVDVMEYLARIPDLEWVILATGDSDFSPLFRRLRELGKSVVGIGPRSPLSAAVENSCNQFIYTDQDPIVSQEPSILTKTLSSPCPSTLPVTLGREISAQEKATSQNGAGNSSGNSLSGKNSSKKKAAAVNSAVASVQSKPDGLSVLEKALHKFPEGTDIATLKSKMVAIDPTFDTKSIGFSKFLKFLQSAPKIVTLYKVKQTWHAIAVSTDEVASNNKNQSKNASKKETLPETKESAAALDISIELYKHLLNKSGWKFCESTLLWDALTNLSNHFPKGFTQGEEFNYLIEIFGRTQTRGTLRAVIYVLCQAGFVVQRQQEMPNNEPVLIAQLPISEREMSRKIDAVVASKLFNICKSNNTAFVPELLRPFLSNSYTKEQFKNLLETLEPYLRLIS